MNCRAEQSMYCTVLEFTKLLQPLHLIEHRTKQELKDKYIEKNITEWSSTNKLLLLNDWLNTLQSFKDNQVTGMFYCAFPRFLSFFPCRFTPLLLIILHFILDGGWRCNL
jgi:hypothetical protein